MKFRLIIICVLFSTKLVRAQNLIINGSFEEIDTCYGDVSPIGFDVFQWTACTNWYCPTIASSDLWCESPVPGSQGPPLILGLGYQYPKDGENMAGIVAYESSVQEYREYIQNKMASPLVSGKYYEFNMHVSAIEQDTNYLNYSSCMQAYFSPNQILNPTSYQALPYDVQWKSVELITDTLGWQKVTGNFKANGGEQYVTIGCFDDSSKINVTNNDPNNSSMIYYFIDDVSMVEMPITIEFPNVFTPNNDGINDLYTPLILNVTDFRLNIYNRWGNLMVCLSETNSEWDGENATEGTYYYVFESEDLNIREQGFFQLVR